jgi:hypothetical protein
MKTCKYGCGGKMKEGGKVATMKKMKVGGMSDKKGLCPDGQYWSVQGCQDKTNKYKPPFSSAGAKAGIVTAVLGTIGSAVKMISDKNKNKQAVKKAAEEAANTPVAKFTKKMDETLKTKKMGGVTKKKYAMGGSTEKALLPMMGMPMYSSNPRSEQGRILKKGGSTSLPVCKGGLVRMPDGSCGNRKFKSGGTLKPVPTDKVGLAKLPTAVRNKMGFQKKGGAVKKKK